VGASTSQNLSRPVTEIVLFLLYNIRDIDMDRECSKHGEKNSTYTVLVVKPEGK
jgi:hypothetical protein